MDWRFYVSDFKVFYFLECSSIKNLSIIMPQIFIEGYLFFVISLYVYLFDVEFIDRMFYAIFTLCRPLKGSHSYEDVAMWSPQRQLQDENPPDFRYSVPRGRFTMCRMVQSHVAFHTLLSPVLFILNLCFMSIRNIWTLYNFKL